MSIPLHAPSALSESSLDAALRMFWRQGYFDTSMEHLTSEAGLNRRAIYAQFGGKRALFEAILLRYRETVMGPVLAPLRNADAGVAALEDFWMQFTGHADAEHGRLGCLMVNAAVEVAPHVEGVATIVRAYLDEVRSLFHAALSRARASGAMRKDADLDVLADYCVGALLGLLTMARSPVASAALRHYVRAVHAYLASHFSGSLS
jgi:TetR/AcrR family transcriptional repressor of nem operon